MPPYTAAKRSEVIRKGDFKPAWWLPSPHLQTLWPVIFRRRATPDLSNQRLELRDGDFVDLCWSRKTGRPVVLLLHGVEGSVHSHYAGSLMLALKAALTGAGWGWLVAALLASLVFHVADLRHRWQAANAVETAP